MTTLQAHTNTGKPLFETFNWFRAFKFFLILLVFLIIIISAIMHFNENRTLTTIVIIVCSLLFIFMGQDSIIVFEDRFEYRLRSLFGLFFRVDPLNINKTYYYKDIKSISIDGFFTQTFDMVEDLITNKFTKADPWNSIDIVFKDEKTKSITTRIYKGDLKIAVKNILQQFIQFNKLQKH